MQFFVQQSELRDLYDKVAAGQRVSEADAVRLFESKDLNAVGAIADLARQRKVGNRASYIVNRYINYSNYCILSCQFCSFARKQRDADGFQFTVEEIVAKAREALRQKMSGTAPAWQLERIAAIEAWLDGVWQGYYTAKYQVQNGNLAASLPDFGQCPFAFADLLAE